MGGNGQSVRKILAVTGIRSEYDLLYSTLVAIRDHPDLELQLIVTGTHLSDVYGRTVREIEADGFEVAERIESMLGSDTPSGRTKSVGIQIIGLVQACARLQPDFLLVVGDREEAIATAVVATYLNIPLAHMCGGDRTCSGMVDEQIRHATTRLAHLHLVMTEEHRERLVRMGEEPWRVHVVGHGGLDRLRSTPEISREKLSERLGIDLTKRPVGVLIQHNLSNEIASSSAQMKTTLEAVADYGMTTAILYPNSDTGSQEIIREIRTFANRLENSGIFPNLPRLDFVNLLRHADVLIGNSSCGVLEAPSLGLPVINVGHRQEGRLHADNIMFVPHDRRQILEAIRYVLTDSSFRGKLAKKKNVYGDGKTGPRVAEILATVELGPKLLHKDITY